ncbi:MAG: hypothetical protein OHK0022_27480 [Roseiflexaceae bacterium]
MLEVELDIFSGMPNPTWLLTDREERELLDRVMAQPTLMSPVSQEEGQLGYRGMIVRLVKEDDNAWAKARLSSAPALPAAFRIGGPATSNQDAQQWLLGTSEKTDTEVDDYLRAVADGTLRTIEAPTSDIDVLPSDATTGEASPDGAAMSCRSNHLTGTNVSGWNQSSIIRNNNCYNFGANHASNTFAQPGRRGGRPFRSMSLGDMAAALDADGWRNGCVPSRNLSIALVVWRDSRGYRDFHFYRLVTSPARIWGHKPGQTAARITDGSGRVIVNPETCNRAPYNLFYGYWYQDNLTSYVR